MHLFLACKQLFSPTRVPNAMSPWTRPAYLLALTSALLLTARAQGQGSVAEQYLFAAANTERAQQHLPALHWDPVLAQAARQHAEQMAARASIAHQYAGEPDLATRARQAGARFSVVAENVGEAQTALHLHQAWMESEHHRANLLDQQVDAIAISVLCRNGQLYAVEDFERSVAPLSLDQQEASVGVLLGEFAALRLLPATADARQTCALDHGYAGDRQPWFVMRFTTGDLNTLPQELRAKLATGRFHEAQAGACASSDPGPFSSFHIAVLLFP